MGTKLFNEDLNQDLSLMEVLNSQTLNEVQIKELAELLNIKERIDKMNEKEHLKAKLDGKRFF